MENSRFDDPPATIKPVIENVTVLETGEVQIKWDVGFSSEIDSFEIKKWFNPSHLDIETIVNDGLFTYTHSPHEACSERSIYTVKPVLLENSTITPLQSVDFQTILLSDSIFYEPCNRTVTIEWNDLLHDAATTYEIWMQEEGQVFMRIIELDAFNLIPAYTVSTYGNSLETTNIYTYSLTGLTAGKTYRLFVEALHGNGQKSRSCTREVFAETYAIPDFFKLLSASINEQNIVELTYEVDTDATVQELEVLRSPESNSLQSVGTFEVPSGSPANLTDETANPSETAYYYQLAYIDSCGIRQDDENIHRTIKLDGTASGDNQNQLECNAYEGWEVDQYLVYRKLANESDYTEIAQLTPSTFDYTDNLALFADQIATISYYVEAVSAEIQISNLPAVSQSNRLQISRESDPIMPNAFKPNGITPIFKPVVSFFGSQRAYLFQIYNRWGQRIFESIDANEGWDGKYKGNLVPGGVYVYLLNYENTDGKNISLRGTVTVVY